MGQRFWQTMFDCRRVSITRATLGDMASSRSRGTFARHVGLIPISGMALPTLPASSMGFAHLTLQTSKFLSLFTT